MVIVNLPWLAHLNCTRSKLLFSGTQPILCIPLAFPFSPKRCTSPVSLFAQATKAHWNFERRNHLQMSFYVPLCFCLHSVSCKYRTVPCSVPTAFAIVPQQKKLHSFLHPVLLKTVLLFFSPNFVLRANVKTPHAHCIACVSNVRTCAIWRSVHGRRIVRTGIHFHRNCVSGLISQGSFMKLSFPPFSQAVKMFPFCPQHFERCFGLQLESMCTLLCAVESWSAVLLFVCLVETVMWFFVVLRV